ncbi:MAG: M50 family metallopeptidase [Faecalicoccus sp.]|nr:M50 family metallopeptidase [Faecalicoccus sp.]
MKYPYVNNTIRVESENDNEVHIYNYITDCHLTLNKEDYEFLMKLDGNTDPYSLSDDKEYVDDIMAFLNSERLVRTGRFMASGLSVYCALWTPKKNGWLERHAPLLNKCILILAPICLFLGLWHYENTYIDTGNVFLLGFFFGIICGVILHELGHAIAALAYGVTVYEMGIGIHSLMPGAYTFLFRNKVLSILQRVQVNLAGLEMNALLAGIFLILSRMPYLHSFFLTGAIANGYMTALNLTGNVIVDGFEAMTDLLGITVKGKPSLKLRPKVHMKGIQKWAFYICMVSIFVTHLISVLLFVDVIVRAFFL